MQSCLTPRWKKQGMCHPWHRLPSKTTTNYLNLFSVVFTKCPRLHNSSSTLVVQVSALLLPPSYPPDAERMPVCRNLPVSVLEDQKTQVQQHSCLSKMVRVIGLGQSQEQENHPGLPQGWRNPTIRLSTD